MAPAVAVAASPLPSESIRSRFNSDGSYSLADISPPTKRTVRQASTTSQRTTSHTESRKTGGGQQVVNISAENRQHPSSSTTTITSHPQDSAALADELDYITVSAPPLSHTQSLAYRPDKASRILGVRHRRSMEPIPASARNSIVSTHSVRDAPPIASFVPSLPLASLYVVSGLPKSPQTWTLADPDSALGLHHSEGAVNRWWRPEVLGSTISPGAGGGKKKKRGKSEENLKGAGALTKQEVGKMLSKALKLSFTREVEIIASTLQPASTVHTFTFTLPAPTTPLAPTPSGDLLRASVMTGTDNRSSAATFNYPYADDPFARPSSAYLGPPSVITHGNAAASSSAAANDQSPSSTITYYGVCLTVWSHADAERSNAIRRTLEAGRSRKESAQSLVASRLKNLRADLAGSGSGTDTLDPTLQARRSARRNARGPWGDAETDGETEGDGAVSESDFEVASTVGHGPGESTLFLPGDTVFWLPYALTLVSRHPVFDLMRDYLTLSWARFSKDVQAHSLQMSRILAHPAPRAGEIIKLDASPKNDGAEASLEVIARFPGGLDFGRGLVDINFTMWPLFKCLNIDNILTICEIALSPTGRVLFFSRYPAMLGIAVNTIKYLVELRGWNGIALPSVHSRDAKIYIDDPGPWIMGLATEARYAVRPASEICVCDLDINYLNCPSPPQGVVSQKQPRDKYRQRLLAAFDTHYHPDHSVPSEFKEAFPAGRFRPVCKIQAKRGGSSSTVAEQIKPPEWWNSTRIIQAFDSVLADRYKKPSLFKRISSFGMVKRPPQLTVAEQLIQLSIRKRATAFVDARDDLETKIGRLSRRLNFLMTESDLWRDKFVTFEQYAEKLSAEANQLRTKINKEQRETKRLSGLVSLTTAEKTKLQTQLRDTEHAHQDAMLELERMRATMESMEQERAEMVAEVEAQIERALASMAVDFDSDYGSSRPGSRLSSAASSRSRRQSDEEAGSKHRQLRSFGTESTLAESYDHADEDTQVVSHDTTGKNRETETIQEVDEEEQPLTPSRKKRFSASDLEGQQDGMNAVDEGISRKSDKIAQKVLEIQQKLESALQAEHGMPKWKVDKEESSEVAVPSLRLRSSRSRLIGKPPIKKRSRSNTTSSTQTAGVNNPATQSDDTASPPAFVRGQAAVLPEENKTPTRGSFSDVDCNEKSAPEPVPVIPSAATSPVPPTPALPSATTTGTADDSDTDFQSAYSASPRDSYGSFENRQKLSDGEDEDPQPIDLEEVDLDDKFGKSSIFTRADRGRISSVASVINTSLPLSDTTITASI